MAWSTAGQHRDRNRAGDRGRAHAAPRTGGPGAADRDANLSETSSPAFTVDQWGKATSYLSGEARGADKDAILPCIIRHDIRHG